MSFSAGVSSDVLSTETELTRRLLARDPAAMEEFYKRYATTLYEITFRIVEREDLAEDVLQEAMVKMWHSFSSYDPARERLFTWAMHVTRDVSIRTMRSQQLKGANTQLPQKTPQDYVQPLAQQLDNLANLAERVSQSEFQHGFQASVVARAVAANSFITYRDEQGHLVRESPATGRVELLAE